MIIIFVFLAFVLFSIIHYHQGNEKHKETNKKYTPLEPDEEHFPIEKLGKIIELAKQSRDFAGYEYLYRDREEGIVKFSTRTIDINSDNLVSLRHDWHDKHSIIESRHIWIMDIEEYDKLIRLSELPMTRYISSELTTVYNIILKEYSDFQHVLIDYEDSFNTILTVIEGVEKYKIPLNDKLQEKCMIILKSFVDEADKVIEEKRKLQEKLDAKTEQSFSELLDYELQFIKNRSDNKWKQ